MSESPLILIDVDGVLNPFPPRGQRLGEPWIRAKCSLDGRTYPVTLNPEHGPKLLKLAEETDAELVWATTWEHDANREIGPRIGLPELPVIEVQWHRSWMGSGVAGVMYKTPHVAAYVGERPFVWFDDDTGAGDRHYLADRCGPCHLVHVNEQDGITDKDIRNAAEWLAGLVGGAGDEDSELMTSAEVAARAGVSAKTVVRWAQGGLLPHERTGSGAYLFRRDVVEGLVQDASLLMFPAELLATLGISRSTMLRWVGSGRLTSVRTLGGGHAFWRSEVEALLQVRLGGSAGGGR